MAAAELRQLYWHASFPKSGNTWARLLLGAYKLGVGNINTNNEVTISDNQLYAYNAVAPIALADMADGAKLYLRNTALMHIIARAIHTPVILKTHHANIEVVEVHLIPEAMTAGAVYMVRDPRDVVISYAEHIGKDIDAGIHAMSQMGHTIHSESVGLHHYLTSWSNHVRGWLDHGKFPRTIIKYEDMLEDTRGEFVKILEAFGMPVIDRKVDYAIEMTQFDELKRQEKRAGFIEASKNTKFFKRGTSGHWKDILTDEQVARIEEDHGEMMQRLGYELVTKAEAA